MTVLSDEQLDKIYYAASGIFSDSLDGLRAVADAAVAAEQQEAERYKLAFEMATEGGREYVYEGWGGRMRRRHMSKDEARVATLLRVDALLAAYKTKKAGGG